MTSRYKNVLKILEKWPLDPSKTDRDIGQFIRDRVKTLFTPELKFIGNTEDCDKQCESLNRLAENHYFKLHARNRQFTATGLLAENCNLILRTENLKLLEGKKGIFSRLFRRKT